MKRLLLASALLSLAFATLTLAQEKPAQDGIKVSNTRVQKLFESMRKGTYNDVTFPELKWEDIPALLEMGASKRVLRCFPVNPISSTAVKECPEGMAALWLVEGLRKGGKDFPSLNALCLPEDERTGTWAEMSAKNQDRVLKAYREWWQQFHTLPAEKAAAVDPLKGARLHWR